MQEHSLMWCWSTGWLCLVQKRKYPYVPSVRCLVNARASMRSSTQSTFCFWFLILLLCELAAYAFFIFCKWLFFDEVLFRLSSVGS